VGGLGWVWVGVSEEADLNWNISCQFSRRNPGQGTILPALIDMLPLHCLCRRLALAQPGATAAMTCSCIYKSCARTSH
jgi:hypothetical protein